MYSVAHFDLFSLHCNRSHWTRNARWGLVSSSRSVSVTDTYSKRCADINCIKDDYLAKPVRGKLLEDMLMKWAVEGKRRHRLGEKFRKPHVDNSSICTESTPGTASDPISDPMNSVNNPPEASNAPKVTATGTSKPIIDNLVSEEQAIMLRDEKLLAASNPNPRQLSISMPPTPSAMRIKLPTPALTVENMALLSREFEVNPFDLLTFDNDDTAHDDNCEDEDGVDSDGSTQRGSNSPEEDFFSFRPRRELARNSSSEVTVVAAAKERRCR